MNADLASLRRNLKSLIVDKPFLHSLLKQGPSLNLSSHLPKPQNQNPYPKAPKLGYPHQKRGLSLEISNHSPNFHLPIPKAKYKKTPQVNNSPEINDQYQNSAIIVSNYNKKYTKRKNYENRLDLIPTNFVYNKKTWKNEFLKTRDGPDLDISREFSPSLKVVDREKSPKYKFVKKSEKTVEKDYRLVGSVDSWCLEPGSEDDFELAGKIGKDYGEGCGERRISVRLGKVKKNFVISQEEFGGFCGGGKMGGGG